MKSLNLLQRIDIIIMNVTVKFSVRELLGELRDGVYTLPEGAAITNLIEASAQEAHRELAEEVKRSIIFLVNNRPASWETPLNDGDSVRVLYKIIGG